MPMRMDMDMGMGMDMCMDMVMDMCMDSTLSVNEFITYATVNSGQEGRICGRPKMIDKEPITGRSP